MCDSADKISRKKAKNKWRSQNVRKSMCHQREFSKSQSTQNEMSKYTKHCALYYTKRIKKYGYEHMHESYMNDDMVIFNGNDELMHTYTFSSLVRYNPTEQRIVYKDTLTDYDTDESQAEQEEIATVDEQQETEETVYRYRASYTYKSNSYICECNKNPKYLQFNCFECGKPFCTPCSDRKLYPWNEGLYSYKICKNCYIKWERDTLYTTLQKFVCDIITSDDIINIIYSYCGSGFFVKCVKNEKCENGIYINSYSQLIDIERNWDYSNNRIHDNYDMEKSLKMYYVKRDNIHIAICSDCDSVCVCVCCSHCIYGYYSCNESQPNMYYGDCMICKRFVPYCTCLQKCKSCGNEYCKVNERQPYQCGTKTNCKKCLVENYKQFGIYECDNNNDNDPLFRFCVKCNEYNLGNECFNCGLQYNTYFIDVKLVAKYYMNDKNYISVLVYDKEYDDDDILRNDIDGRILDCSYNIKEYSISKWNYYIHKKRAKKFKQMNRKKTEKRRKNRLKICCDFQSLYDYLY